MVFKKGAMPPAGKAGKTVPAGKPPVGKPPVKKPAGKKKKC